MKNLIIPAIKTNSLIKIKFNLGLDEIINTWAVIKKHGSGYALFFEDCYSYESCALFDSGKRCFYGKD